MVNNDVSFRSFADLQGLDSLKHQARGNSSDPKTLEAVAKQFESLFLNMLLKNMRQANESFSKDSYFESNQTKFYRDMLDQQLSLTLSQGKGVGLSEVLVRQLSPKSSQAGLPATAAHEGLNRQAFDQQLDKTIQAAVEAMANKPPVDTKPLDDNATRPETEAAPPASTPAMPELKPGDFANAISAVETRLAQLENHPDSLRTSLSAEELPGGRFDTPQAFVTGIYPIAKRVAGGLGLDPSVLVAQAALETGWGKHLPGSADGRSSFNLFGIKADNRWHGDSTVVNTLEFRDGVAAKEKASFRAYGSYEESMRDYVDFVRSNPRYQPALEQAGDGQAYLQQLQLAGYATDPKYAQKIAGILTGDVLQSALAGIKEI